MSRDAAFAGSECRHIDAPATAVFALVTDVDRLPEWNAVIRKVVERPAELAPGAEWVVVIDPPKIPKWKSRSQVIDIDPVNRRFAHRTSTDDSNPSYADWVWRVDESPGGGCDVTVSWDVHPLTRFRKVFGPAVRKPQLSREVPASLDALAAVVTKQTVH